MSQGSNRKYVRDKVHIGTQEVKHTSVKTEGNQTDEETSAMTAKVKNEKYVEHVVKEEVVNDVNSDNDEYYIFPDEMKMEVSGHLPYLRAAVSAEDSNSNDSTQLLLVDASSKSNEFLDGNNGQPVETDDKTALYIDLDAKEEHKSKIHKKRLDFSECFNLKSPNSGRSLGSKCNDYDAEIVIYPVQHNTQNIEGNRVYLNNTSKVTRKADTCSDYEEIVIYPVQDNMQDSEGNRMHLNKTGNVTRKSDTNKRYNQYFQDDDCGELQMQDSGKIIDTVERNETHPFKCEECGESFELKSYFVMHELGHEKYKFYSFRTNTIKCICVHCKTPYFYSADDKERYSNMCVPCLAKLRERITVCNNDKRVQSGTKHLVAFSGIKNTPKVKGQKQCYSCGRRSHRYFVYGASQLCNECWQDRIHRAKRSYKSVHTSFQRGNYRRHNSAYTRYEERDLLKSQVPQDQCQHAEENLNLIGTHFLLSAFDSSPTDTVEEEDDDFQEDWKETEISAFEDESDSNTVILCDRTGEFIDINCSV